MEEWMDGWWMVDVGGVVGGWMVIGRIDRSSNSNSIDVCGIDVNVNAAGRWCG